VSGAAPPGFAAVAGKPRRKTRQRTSLRTSLIWHDEVMDDVVLDTPKPITFSSIGGGATFTVPHLNGLPERFVMVKPGNRGYLLTLGEHMRGTICVDGEEKAVEEFVRRGGEGESPAPGGFRATAIGGKDWGVVDLDETGVYKLFFQFVTVDEEIPLLTKPVLYAILAGWLISIVSVGLIFAQRRGVDLSEALFRGFLMSTGLLTAAALLRWLLSQDNESQASFTFSVFLHAALLIMTYRLYDGKDPFVWPGPRDLTGSYLATRLTPETPPEPEKPKPAAAVAANTTANGPKSPEKKIMNTATKGDQGASGGKGDTERARDPNAKNPPEPPKVALFTENNRKVLDNIIERNLPTGLSKFQGMQGELRKGSTGYGHGTGFGVGDEIGGSGTTRGGHGHGPGGGGNVDGDFVSNKGPVDPGTVRGGGNCVGASCKGNGPKEVKVAFADASGDLGGLTKEEIDRVVRARAGIFRACYQKELNRAPGLSGKLVVRFAINGDGMVTSSSIGSGGSLHNEEVESCINANVRKLKFPAKGGTSNVTYPFVFSQGG
jgi:outer membrane biosynthesis protein TonB